MRRSTRPPGSTLTISGSASVRKLARKASYLTSLRSGPDWAARHRRRHLHARRRRHRGGRLRHARHRARVLQILEDLFRGREAEIRQHHHDLLLVRPVALVVDDERRRHQPLLLQPLMRVHPERAAEAQREVIVRAAARGNRRSGNPRHAVLPPGRRQPVPMDQARFADAVFDPDPKGLADLGREAKGPVWLLDGVDRRRPAVHLDIAPLKPQDRRRRSGAVRRVLRPGEDRGRPPSLKRRPQEVRVGIAWEASSGEHADGHYQRSSPSGTCSDRRLPANDGSGAVNISEGRRGDEG